MKPPRIAPVSTPIFELGADNCMNLLSSSGEILNGSFGLEAEYGGLCLIRWIKPGVLKSGDLVRGFGGRVDVADTRGESGGLLNLCALAWGDKYPGDLFGLKICDAGILVGVRGGICEVVLDGGGGW